ncbi:MAG TPA: hypothetical protein VK968_12260, partial [Roseimicrobium sp.]|nr:hypothetical protein [Roseimicrobium sp.]
TLSLPLPKKILFIKTTGDDEGAAAYTRSNAIIIPKHELMNSAGKNRKLICHELFHILSRENPALREKLYALIGFVKCDEVPFPAELKSRKITNPDAPRNDHCIRLQVDGKERWAVPILFSRAEKYDVQMGGEFFRYLQFRFLLVERKEGISAVTPIRDGPNAALAELDSVTGYFEQIGMNTEYVIHPEEILADNFALMVLRDREVDSPSILKRLEQALRDNPKK